jgi:NADH dehydrogenase/NADH:ubiquinone oxidoreductase subunit G
MTDKISITIDGQPVEVIAGTTLLKAALSLGIVIPTICYHEYCTSNSLCRICVVEVEGSRVLAPACTTVAVEGMKVSTATPRVQAARRTILEMLAGSVDLSEAPEILAMQETYSAQADHYPDAEKRSAGFFDDNPMFVRDYSRCILCWRCVQVCAKDAQYTYAINFSGRGYNTQIATFFDRTLTETTCVFCGQCVAVCPTGALKPKREFLLELGYQPEEIMKLTRNERKRRLRKDRQPVYGEEGPHES